MVLRKSRDKLTEVMDQRAQDRSNVMGGLGKTQIDKDVKLGKKAYSGEFSGAGVIDTLYQDHGTGRNVLRYKDVDLSGYPYAVWSPGTTDEPNTYLVFSTLSQVQQDVLEVRGALNTWTDWNNLTYRTASPGDNGDYILSVYAASPNVSRVQVRAVHMVAAGGSFTLGPVLDQSVEVDVGATSDEVRIPLSFSVYGIPSSDLIRLQARVFRTGGAAGTLAGGQFYNPMLERVEEGQTRPSKFTMPLPDRGDFAVNLLEHDALLGHRAGVDVSVDSVGINVTAGTVYIPGSGRIVEVLDDLITMQGVGASSVWSYVYAYELNSGFGGIMRSTTPPDAPYAGHARVMSGSGGENYRYLTSVWPLSLNVGRPFTDDGYFVQYYNNRGDRTALSNGAATSNTNFSVASFVPPHCRRLQIDMGLVLGPNNGTAYITFNGSGLSPAASEGLYAITVVGSSNRARVSGPIPCMSDRLLRYANSASGLDLGVIVVGYYDPR